MKFNSTDLANIQRMVDGNKEVNEWIIDGNFIRYTDYIGKGGMLVKSATQMMIYLFEIKQKEDSEEGKALAKALKGITTETVEKVTEKGFSYKELRFKSKNLPLALTILNELTKDYRRDWREANPDYEAKKKEKKSK